MDEKSPLADAARLVRLARPHRHRVEGAPAAPHARFLLQPHRRGLEVRRMAPRDALRDADTARAYPTTLSRRDAVVAFARGARPKFYDDESQATAVTRRRTPVGWPEGPGDAWAGAEESREEVVAYCLRVLDGGDDGAQLKEGAGRVRAAGGGRRRGLGRMA